MTIQGTTLIGRLAAVCTLLLAFTACGGGGGGFLAENTALAITTTGLPEASAGAGYTALVEATGGNPPYAWAITNSGGTDLKIDNDGFVTGIAPAVGNYTLVIEVIDRSDNREQLTTVLTVITGPDSLAIATTALPNAIDGISYTALIEAVGGKEPYTWAVTEQDGTEFSINNEGILSGIAPRSGDYGLSLQVTDSTDIQITESFVLTVIGDTPQPLAITTTSPLPSVEEGKAYTAILEAAGGQGDYFWFLDNDGGSSLELRDFGALVGTAPLEGQYAIAVSVTDDTRTVSSTLILEVTADPFPLAIIQTTLPPGFVGVPYAAVLEAIGGDAPYAWTLIESGQSTIGLSSAGILAGTPTTSGSFGLSYRVTDAVGNTVQSSSLLTIDESPATRASATAAKSGFQAMPLKITTQTLSSPNSLTRYATAVVATGGKQPYNWTGRDMNSPATGLTVDPIAGSITGDLTSVATGSYNYTVTVQDANGNSDTRTYLIKVF